jgi:hypothetical protein
MKNFRILTALLLGVACSIASGQIKRTSVPLGDALSKALAKGLITGENARPFHIRIEITEPENPQSPYQGAFEEWWISPDQWRREATMRDGMRQTIVVAGGKKTEKDEGDYFPVWLRNFVKAAFDPVPAPELWTGHGMMIDQMFMPNGAKSDACARTQGKIGSTDRDSTVYFNVCFDEEGTLKFVGSPGYGMEFHDYRNFGKKKIARTLVDDPESGTRLVGKVTVLEDESKASGAADSFAPLAADEDRFRDEQVNAVTMEKLTASDPPIVWPTVHSGNLKGKVAIYVSADTEGHVREVWPINADNGVDDSAREQVRKWTIKPATDKDGKRVQVDGPLSFYFETRIDNPLPELGDAEVRELATKIVEPVWPPNSVSQGEIIEAQVSVNEQGKVTGTAFPNAHVPTAVGFAISDALRQWAFKPLIRNGAPQYFHGNLKFVVK